MLDIEWKLIYNTPVIFLITERRNMSEQKWVAGWGTGISTILQNHSEYFKNETFRYMIFPTMDATALRLHFSNEYGDEPCTIDKTFVAQASSDKAEAEKIVPETNRQVTFGGNASVTLQPGESCVSDEIPFDVFAGKSFAVSIYIKEMTKMMTGHSNSGVYIKKYFSSGDYSESAVFPNELYGDNPPYFCLHTIDFLTDAEQDCHAVIAFGDSITAQPWPDYFAHRLFDLGIRDRAVIRKGIGGGRVLREYECRIKKHWGVAGIRRFERDILQAGADRVIVLHGTNDIIHPNPNDRFYKNEVMPTADELINLGYRKYIEIAHAHGMKIYLATILPCPRCLNGDGEKEKVRCGVNDWIRSQTEADGVIDFESAMWNPLDHKQLLEGYDSGDHLHPSLAGAKHMAETVPLEFLK